LLDLAGGRAQHGVMLTTLLIIIACLAAGMLIIIACIAAEMLVMKPRRALPWRKRHDWRGLVLLVASLLLIAFGLWAGLAH
jgi:hypothetical protein